MPKKNAMTVELYLQKLNELLKMREVMGLSAEDDNTTIVYILSDSPDVKAAIEAKAPKEFKGRKIKYVVSGKMLPHDLTSPKS